MYYHDEGRANDASDRRDVADEIEIQSCRRAWRRVGRSDQEERVAVCRHAHDRFGTNIAARARPVLDDEWLAQPAKGQMPPSNPVDINTRLRRMLRAHTLECVKSLLSNAGRPARLDADLMRYQLA